MLVYEQYHHDSIKIKALFQSDIKLKWKNKTSVATCIHCMDTEDVNIEEDVISWSLKVSQTCALCSMVFDPITTLMFVAYVLVSNLVHRADKSSKALIVVTTVFS